MPKTSAVFLLAVLLSASAAHAQTVQGTFADPTGGPVAGARAILRDAAGNEVAATHTGPDGAFTLRAPAAGSFVLRVERIGYATTQTGPIALGAGETVRRTLSAAPGRIVLDRIVAESRSRCVPRPGSGPETATVWSEARKVLGSARESGESTDFRYSVRRFWREVDPPGRTILHDSAASAVLATPSPFVAVPLDRLSRHGYVERAGGGHLHFHAPDARVLLSDAFQARHCFALTPGPDGLIGLSFTPVSDRVPDVRGTLWLDRATAELRKLEYHYTRVPDLPPEGQDASGWMEFTRLADGRWIVGRWTIRMPVVMAVDTQALNLRELSVRNGRQVRLAGFREEGGEVLAAGPAGGPPALLADPGAITGTVWDSTTAQPLAGATVSAAGHRATTDSLGRYLIEDVPAGAYSVTLAAPRLDSLRYHLPPARAEVAAGASTLLPLAVPPSEVVWGAACGTPRPGTGAVVGRVRGADGRPAAGARVTVTWSGAQPGGLGAPADSGGVYRVCGAPAGVPLTLRVSTRDAAVVMGGVAAAADRPLRQDVELPAVGAFGNGTSAAPDGVISGVLRDARGQPLAGAQVAIDTLPPATTDAQGRFRLAIVPAGEHRLAVRHPRVGTRTAQVPLPAEAVVMEVRAEGESALGAVVRRVVRLAPLTASAQPRSVNLAGVGFYERQRTGIGRFLDDRRLHRTVGRSLADELKTVPGLRITQSTAGHAIPGGIMGGVMRGIEGGTFAMSTRQAGQCWMDVYLDGVLVAGARLGAAYSLSLDEIPTSQLEAVEVYQGSEIPVQYRDTRSMCGVILMWTR
ncbi:MAG TPA: carboxypeptidase regulatory-like domain-containing protein, partial [Longimicrobium sp.]|nr:carboxypeptidase regulatory-like domain-containing protein [Longimicrobium sp.]